MTLHPEREATTRPVMPMWSIDWLSATLHPHGDHATYDGQSNVVRRLVLALDRPLHGAEEKPAWTRSAGRHGYTCAVSPYQWPGLRIEWAGTEAQGIHVSISGKASQRLSAEDGGQAVPWPLRLTDWLARHGDVSITRLDVALDTETYSPSAVLLARTVGVLVTRLQKGPQQTSERGRGNGTVTLGSRKGLVYVRAYDKADEQAGKDAAKRRALGPWYRLEFEYHDERANRVMDAWREHGWAGVAGEIDATVSFRTPQDGDGNTARWPLQSTWAEILGTAPVPPVARVATERDRTLQEKADWLRTTGAGILAKLMREYGWEWVNEWLAETVAQGETRLLLHDEPPYEAQVPPSTQG